MKYIVFLNRHFTRKDAHLVLVEFKRVRGYVKYIVFLNRHYTLKDAHLVLVEFKKGKRLCKVYSLSK